MKEVSSEKMAVLRDMILDSAAGDKQKIISDARAEAEEWLLKEAEKLEREKNMIIQDARKRAEEIRRRQIMSAERDKAADALRLQNRMLTEALGRFQDKLIHLRGREDYAGILAGMCADAAASLAGAQKLKLRLAVVDAHLAGDVIDKVKISNPGVEIIFDAEPAPISGGCWITTEDGKRLINSDWQNIAQEMADTLAERLLPLL